MRRAFGRVLQKPPRRGWYVRFRHKGREYERAAGPTKTGAAALLARVHAGLGQRRPVDEVLAEVFGDPVGPNLTLREAVPKYIEYARLRKKTTTMAGQEPRLRIIAKQPWAQRPLREIRTRDISRFAAQLAEKGPRGKACSGATINRYLAGLSAIYRWAIAQGYAATNPVKGVDRFSEKGRGREVYLEAGEVRALLDAASEAFRPLLAFAVSTGCRRGEILQLRWRDVHWRRAEATIRPENSKTGEGRPVPLPEELVALLRALRASQAARRIDGDDPVFQLPDGAAWTWAAVRREFARAVDRCESLPPWKATRLRFHDLRHTYASLAIQNGAPLHTVSRILGHSSLQTTMRYAHWSPDDRRRVAHVVGSVLAPAPRPGVETGGG